MRRIHRLAACLWVFTFLQLAHPQNNQANAGDEKPKTDIKWSKMTVQVVDPEGKPLEGATVRPWALRSGNGHGMWNDKRYGEPSTTTTNADGKADVTFPESNEWSHKNKHPVTQVSLDVRHADFCAANIHTDVPKDDAKAIPELKLERGTKLRIAGVAPGMSEPLPDCYVEFEGREAIGAEFHRESSGWLQTTPLKDNQRWYQVVRLSPGEAPQFSLPQAWNPDDPTSKERLVAVHPGTKVVGKISSDVPQPIVCGVVVVRCGSPARTDDDGKRAANRPFWWMDYTPIAEDGSFEFASLPAGTLGQFYAFANDYISAQPNEEAYETCCKWFGLDIQKQFGSFRYGQILRLPRGQAELEIEMELGGTVQVKCTDEGGNLVSGVQVTSWPNQYTVAGGSTLLCACFSSREMFTNNFRIDPKKAWKQTPFFSETNKDGIALIRNLPKGKQSFFAENEVWGMKDELDATSEPGETVELTIPLERKTEP